MEQEANDRKARVASYRANEDKLKFVLDILRPIDLSKRDCNPNNAEEYSKGNYRVNYSFV